MVGLLVALTVTLCRLFKQARFAFVIKLIVLCMVSDFAFLVLTLGFYCEQTSVHNDATDALAAMIGLMSFVYNYGSNLMYWLFSFKYWVIAKEVPKLFESKQISFQEGSYSIISTVGSLVNLIPCMLIAYYRAMLTVDSADGLTPSEALIDTVQAIYFVITAC